MAVVVSSKLATLYELHEMYSYEDMLDMYEILLINYENELEASKKNGR